MSSIVETKLRSYRRQRVERLEALRKIPRYLRAFLTLLSYAIGIIAILPILWTLSLSIRTNEDVFSNRLLPHTFHPHNFPHAWQEFHLGVLFAHSAIITVGTVVLACGLSVTAAYGFSRYRSRLSEGVFILILTGLMIPPAAIILPFFLTMKNFHLYNSLFAVIIGESAFALPFGVLVLRGYIDNVPRELTDAALVDGATDWKAFWYVVLPLLRPGLATAALFTTISTWNGFLIPLVLLSNSTNATITVGLQPLNGEFGNLSLELMSAAAVLAILPILVVFLVSRRYYVQGLSAGAIKA
jgi:ABC-type glycerol-3-phosphate transport system permease component